MARFSKRGRVTTKAIKTQKLCPHCGHDEFKAIDSKMSWLFGQKFLCAKCGGKFRSANLVRASKKSKQFSVNQTGTSHRARRSRSRH